jgi:imidazolonepropionase-like amidohydrolase
MKPLLNACRVAMFLFPLHAQEPAVAIGARAMIDVERGRLIENATVVIRGGRIVAVGSSADATVPANASLIHLPATNPNDVLGLVRTRAVHLRHG